MDVVMSPWESAARVDYIRELASKGDLAELSRALLLANDSWHEGFGVTTVPRGLAAADRIALARSFAEHAGTTPADSEVATRGLVLLAAVSRDITDANWCNRGPQASSVITTSFSRGTPSLPMQPPYEARTASGSPTAEVLLSRDATCLHILNVLGQWLPEGSRLTTTSHKP